MSQHRRGERHFPELDGIRGLAIVGVLCSHGVGLSGLFDGSHNFLADKLLSYACVPLCGGGGSLLCAFWKNSDLLLAIGVRLDFAITGYAPQNLARGA
jgi:peptidoglycan/LPS O-acetylase OafA/YrhL